MITGWKKPDKGEQAHLRENGVRTNHDLQVTLEWQRTHLDHNGNPMCRICVNIAEKLQS